MVISFKVSVIVWLVFELTYENILVQSVHLSHNRDSGLVASISQIDLTENYLYSIEPFEKKKEKICKKLVPKSCESPWYCG